MRAATPVLALLLLLLLLPPTEGAGAPSQEAEQAVEEPAGAAPEAVQLSEDEGPALLDVPVAPLKAPKAPKLIPLAHAVFVDSCKFVLHHRLLSLAVLLGIILLVWNFKLNKELVGFSCCLLFVEVSCMHTPHNACMQLSAVCTPQDEVLGEGRDASSSGVSSLRLSAEGSVELPIISPLDRLLEDPQQGLQQEPQPPGSPQHAPTTEPSQGAPQKLLLGPLLLPVQGSPYAPAGGPFQSTPEKRPGAPLGALPRAKESVEQPMGPLEGPPAGGSPGGLRLEEQQKKGAEAARAEVAGGYTPVPSPTGSLFLNLHKGFARSREEGGRPEDATTTDGDGSHTDVTVMGRLYRKVFNSSLRYFACGLSRSFDVQSELLASPASLFAGEDFLRVFRVINYLSCGQA
ncbi:hypothetical protein Efla_003144 [Eimeria flavescens]